MNSLNHYCRKCQIWTVLDHKWALRPGLWHRTYWQVHFAASKSSQAFKQHTRIQIEVMYYITFLTWWTVRSMANSEANVDGQCSAVEICVGFNALGWNVPWQRVKLSDSLLHLHQICTNLPFNIIQWANRIDKRVRNVGWNISVHRWLTNDHWYMFHFLSFYPWVDPIRTTESKASLVTCKKSWDPDGSYLVDMNL